MFAFTKGIAMNPYRILVAVDFSEQTHKVLDYAAFLARSLKGTLELLYVWPPPQYVVPDAMLIVPGFSEVSLEKHARAEAAKDFEKLLGGFDKGELSVSTRIEVGRPGAAIVRAANEDQADLIVIGTHGRTGLTRWFLGSVAQEVVSKAPCPVVTVRSPDDKK